MNLYSLRVRVTVDNGEAPTDACGNAIAPNDPDYAEAIADRTFSFGSFCFADSVRDACDLAERHEFGMGASDVAVLAATQVGDCWPYSAEYLSADAFAEVARTVLSVDEFGVVVAWIAGRS
jgi:hypothetical protein